MAYVELHAGSAFSFLRGGSFPEHLAETAGKLEMPAMALLDRNGVYGSQRFSTKARENNVRPIVGCELTMEDGSVLPVLVKTETGYANLCSLLTEAHLRSEVKGECAVRWNELPEYTDGLVSLLGSAGCQPAVFGSSPKTSARAPRKSADTAQRLTSAFGAGNVYVEIQRHFLRGEEQQNRALIDLAQNFGLPIIATNGVQYATRQHREVFDVFTCIREHTHLDAAGKSLAQNAERHLKGDREMRELFRDLPAAITNTERLADRLEFSLEKIGYAFPDFSVPAGHDMNSFLRTITWFGAQQRYEAISTKVRRKLEEELTLITKLGFAGYFLIVWDIVNFCREHNVMVQGRGSAANSAVCFCLGITPVDPVSNHLVFERFLSESRKG
ncbi:MAG: PHP domain-containing protein, partial [Verrucomicrobiota bacterium]|nr:PHP domain-containing protein [Verrucomicrobiota bacterium]